MSEQEKLNQDGAQEQAKQTKPAKAEKTKADKPKAAKERKPGFFNRLGRFFRDLKAELKKVAWPSGSDTMKKTGIVVVCVIIVGIFIWLFDWLAGEIISALLDLFRG